jgi:riboflavin synthase
LLWRVETDLNVSYEECAKALKEMKRYSFNRADKHAANPTRMWQGTNSGFFHYAADGKRLNLKQLAK